jgi:protein SCO1/2
MVTTRFSGGEQSAASAVTIGGPFRLTDQDGRPLSSDALKGEPFAIYFGFTRCPDICPTTLSELANAMQTLGPEADRMHYVFVTLDPTRDTPQVMKEYVGAFDSRIVGLTGSEADVGEAAKSYHIFWEKVPTENGDYTLNHTATVFLMDGQGVLSGALDYGDSAEVVVTKLRHLIESKTASL